MSSFEEVEHEEQVLSFGEHSFVVSTIGELPLELLCELEAARDEISGQRAWPGSLLLACHVRDAAGDDGVAGRRVLELGAGCGVAGMLAARRGAADVVVTDGDARCARLLRQNVARNAPFACGVRVAELRWGDDAALAALLRERGGAPGERDGAPGERDGAFDLILAGDVLYKDELVAPFLATVHAALAAGGARARCLLCHLPRAGVTHARVRAAIAARGLRCALVAAADAAAVVGGPDCTADDVAAAALYRVQLAEPGAGDGDAAADGGDGDLEADDDDGGARADDALVARVSGLNRDASLALVHRHFARCGRVAMVYKTAPDEAAVQFDTREAAVGALSLDGTEIAGGRIAVRAAAPEGGGAVPRQ